MHAAARGHEPLAATPTPNAQSQDVVFAVDPTRGTIAYASERTESLVDTGEFSPAEGDSVEALVETRTAEHEAHRHSHEMKTRDGARHLISERPTSDGGIAGVYTDITQLKSAQDDPALRRNRPWARDLPQPGRGHER